MPRGPHQPHDFTPEDRSRGCIWSSVFRDAESEVAKGATLIGTPKIDHGLEVDWPFDALLYALNGQLAEIDQLSVHAVIRPAFTYDDGAIHTLLGTTGDNYRIRKDISGDIEIILGGTALTAIDDSAYYQFWRPHALNVFSLSADSAGANDAWLNGQHVMVGEATGWTATDDAQMAVGSTTAPGDFWAGGIRMLKLYDQIQTAQEHLDLCAGVGI